MHCEKSFIAHFGLFDITARVQIQSVYHAVVGFVAPCERDTQLVFNTLSNLKLFFMERFLELSVNGINATINALNSSTFKFEKNYRAINTLRSLTPAVNSIALKLQTPSKCL